MEKSYFFLAEKFINVGCCVLFFNCIEFAERNWNGFIRQERDEKGSVYLQIKKKSGSSWILQFHLIVRRIKNIRNCMWSSNEFFFFFLSISSVFFSIFIDKWILQLSHGLIESKDLFLGIVKLFSNINREYWYYLNSIEIGKNDQFLLFKQFWLFTWHFVSFPIFWILLQKKFIYEIFIKKCFFS